MFEYNNKLLDLQPKVTEEDVKNMTKEQFLTGYDEG